MIYLFTILCVVIFKVNANYNQTNRNHNYVRDLSANWFLRHTPMIDLTKIDNISERCRKDFNRFLNGIENLELWALKSESFSEISK